MLSSSIATALTAAPIPILPESLEDLTYRSQLSTEPMATPFIVIEDAGTQNLTRNSLRKCAWEARLHTSPDQTPPEDAPIALRALESHLHSEEFTAALAAALPADLRLLSFRVMATPTFRIEDRIITDTLTGTATIGVQAPD
jgi:hypothetical protein